MSHPPDESLQGSLLSAQALPPSSQNLEGIKLPIGRGPLRPTRGGNSRWGSRGPGRLSSHGRTPAQPREARHSSTSEPSFAVVIDPAVTPFFDNSASPSNGHDHRGGSVVSSVRRRRGRQPKNIAKESVFAPSPRRVGRPPKSITDRSESQRHSIKRKPGRPRIHPLSRSASRGKRTRPDPKMVSPKFVPFLCEWKGCRAELHNLETLRRHIFTVHDKKQPSGDFVCLWAKCGISQQANDNVIVIDEDYAFSTLEAMKTHIEKAHLVPFAWHMGDGPRSSTLAGSESDASTLPSEAAGRQSVSSAASQLTQRGSANLNIARRESMQNRLIDPSLESLDLLVTPALKAGFSLPSTGTWERIKVRKQAPSPESP